METIAVIGRKDHKYYDTLVNILKSKGINIEEKRPDYSSIISTSTYTLDSDVDKLLQFRKIQTLEFENLYRVRNARSYASRKEYNLFNR